MDLLLDINLRERATLLMVSAPPRPHPQSGPVLLALMVDRRLPRRGRSASASNAATHLDFAAKMGGCACVLGTGKRSAEVCWRRHETNHTQDGAAQPLVANLGGQPRWGRNAEEEPNRAAGETSPPRASLAAHVGRVKTTAASGRVRGEGARVGWGRALHP